MFGLHWPIWLEVLTIIVLIGSIGALGFGIAIIVLWIKLSWIRKTNSLDINGAQLTEKIFKEEGIDLEIKKSIWYAKYWNNNKKKKTYRLRHWTYNRKSIWTMMEATQQAYATSIRDSNKKVFWLAFRLPSIVGGLGGIVGFALMFWPLIFAKVWIADYNSVQILSAVAGFIIMGLSQAFAIVSRQYYLKRDAHKLIENIGFSQEELALIQKIWVWLYYYAIVSVIMQVLKTLLEMLGNSRGNNNSSWRK